MNRASVYIRKSQFDRAIADFDEAIRLDPADAMALFGRGFARVGRGDLDGAISDYTAGVRLDPKCARPVRVPRRRLREQGRPRQRDRRLY